MLSNFNSPHRIESSANDSPIILNQFCAKVFHPLNCDTFLQSNLASTAWHQVLIYTDTDLVNKEEIIEEIYKTIDGSLILPISYRREKNLDYFFVHGQDAAIKKLIEKKLQIQVKGYVLPILVKLNIAQYYEGNTRPTRSLLNIIKRKILAASGFKLLDFSCIQKEPELSEIYISFKNKAVFNMFLSQLNSMKEAKANIRALKFDENEIQSLEPFSKLYDFRSLRILSLSKNNVTDINELQYLKTLRLEELYVEDNFGFNQTKPLLIKYEKKIQETLTTLKKVNGVPLSSAFMEATIGENSTENEDILNVGDGISITQNNMISYRTRFDRDLKDNCWHLVTFIHHRRFNFQQIMNELVSNVLSKSYFYPCYLKHLSDRDEFFVYKNKEALKILFDSGLKVKMSRSSFTVDVHLRLNVAEHNGNEIFWVSKIIGAVTKRIRDNTLNLNGFPESADFQKIVVPMSSPTLDFIVSQAKKLNLNIKRIDVEHCNITSCDGFQYIFTLPKLTTLNLRNNKISDLAGLKKNTMIKEIYLDGNEICNKSPMDYVAHISHYLPQLELIDDHKIQKEFHLINFQNYLVSREVYPIVAEFIRVYFELCDSFDRLKLLEMYGEKAIFSMSIYYEHNQEHSNLSFGQIYPRVQALVKINRNLSKISNMNQYADNIFIGKDIQKFFNIILRTKHKMSTFTIDVPMQDIKNKLLLITVGGVFEEIITESTGASLAYGFSRSFLIKSNDSEFKILNDQLLILSPSVAQLEAMKQHEVVQEKDIMRECKDLMPNEAEENSLKLIMLQELTECTKEYCYKYVYLNI